MGYELDVAIIYAHKPVIKLEFGDGVVTHEHAASQM